MERNKEASRSQSKIDVPNEIVEESDESNVLGLETAQTKTKELMNAETVSPNETIKKRSVYYN